MFRALICPSSGVCDYIVELPHWPFHSAKDEELDNGNASSFEE